MAHVHLAFYEPSSRIDVLELLDELGPWEGGRLVEEPGHLHFEISSDDLVLCEIAVRARLAVALSGTGLRVDRYVAVVATGGSAR